MGGAAKNKWSEGLQKHPTRLSRECSGWQADVIVKVSAHLIVSITHASRMDASGSEQQPRGLDGAGAEDEVIRLKAEPRPGVVADKNGLDTIPPGSKQQFRHIRMQVYRDEPA